MRHLFILLFSCLALNCANAQSGDSLKYKYVNFSIYRYGGSFIKGNEKLSFKDLSREFSMSELGLESYTQAKKYRTVSTILRYVSLVAGFSALGIAANNGNKNTVIIFLGGQLVTGLGSSRYAHLSTQSLDRALWQRNKDLLFPGSQ